MWYFRIHRPPDHINIWLKHFWIAFGDLTGLHSATPSYWSDAEIMKPSMVGSCKSRARSVARWPSMGDISRRLIFRHQSEARPYGLACSRERSKLDPIYDPPFDRKGISWKMTDQGSSFRRISLSDSPFLFRAPWETTENTVSWGISHKLEPQVAKVINLPRGLSLQVASVRKPVQLYVEHYDATVSSTVRYTTVD